jgi:hypothetical protein
VCVAKPEAPAALQAAVVGAGQEVAGEIGRTTATDHRAPAVQAATTPPGKGGEAAGAEALPERGMRWGGGAGDQHSRGAIWGGLAA